MAISRKSGAVGYSYRAVSLAQARSLAMSSCKQIANDCIPTGWAANQCLAFAWSGDHAYSVQLGATEFAAERFALDTCRGYGGTSCRLLRTSCSSYPGRDLRAAAGALAETRR